LVPVAARATLHLVSGGTVDVAEDPTTAAQKLWSHKPGSDVPDMGYAAMQTPDAKPVNVNPQAVACVTEPRTLGTEPMVQRGG